MLSFDKVLEFIKDLNQIMNDFLSFKDTTKYNIFKEQKKCGMELENFKANIQAGLANYKKSYLESMNDKINSFLNQISDVYQDDIKNVKKEINFVLYDNLENAKEALTKLSENLNADFSKLLNIDFDEMVPPKEITIEGEKIHIKQGRPEEILNTNSKIETLRIPKIIDSNLIKETIKDCLFADNLIQQISQLFEKKLNIEELNKQTDGLLKNYKQEIASIGINKINQKFAQTLNLSQNVKKYLDFISDLKTTDSSTLPNVETGSDSFHRYIQIGKTKLKLFNTLDVDYFNNIDVIGESFPDNKIDIPIVADLKIKGNILINLTNDNYDSVIKSFVNQLIIEFSLSFPSSLLHFQFVDINNRMSLSTFASLSKINNNIFVEGIIRDDSKLESTIKNLKNIKFFAEDKLNAEGLPDIFEYNKKMDSTPMAVYLFVIVDFPSRIDKRLANDIKSILLDGNKYGIFSILINNQTINLEYDFNDYIKLIDDISSVSHVLTCNDNGATKNELSFCINRKFYDFEPLDKYSTKILPEIVGILSANAHRETSKPIPLTKMFNFIDSSLKKSIATDFEIPFGLSGFEVQTLDFTNGSHAAVIGGTGSGKSIFFHTLILDACYKYSPEELNLYLLDFKGGTEFSYYSKNKLPHIKLIGLTKDMNDGLSIFINLKDEMERRMLIFRSEGAENLETYYKKGNKQKIARLFVIIDEIQEIFSDSTVGEKALDILSQILAQGRAFGINVLWGSQGVPSIPSIDNKLMQNIKNRISLSVESTDYALRLFGDGINLRPLIDIKNRPEKGYGVISDARTGNSIQEFRVAYSENAENRSGYYTLVKQKWTAFITDDLYVIGDEMIPDFKKDSFFNNTSSAPKSKLSSFYKINLGTSYVSGKTFSINLKTLGEKSNVLFIGTNGDLLRDLIGFSVLSLIRDRKEDSDLLVNKENKILLVNKEGTMDPNISFDLFNLLKKHVKNQIQVLSTLNDFVGGIKFLYYKYLERVKSNEENILLNDKTAYFFVVHYFQYLNDLLEDNPIIEDSGFDFDGNEVPPIKLTDTLKTLLNNGGNYGIHFVFSLNANNLDSLFIIKKELQSFANKVITMGADYSLFDETSISKTSKLNSDKVCICICSNNVTKIRPYRFDGNNKLDKTWYEDNLKSLIDGGN